MPTSRLIRLPTGSRRLAGSPRTPALDQRIDGAAEIGAEHQRQRGLRRDELRKGKRHHQEHDGDARMRRPGQRRRDEDAQHRIVGDGGEQRAHRRRLLGRRQRVEQDVQRQAAIRPSPMAMRPIARVRLDPPTRKVTRPMTNSTGATAEMSNDRSCTISVVPTLAPSMMASAGHEADHAVGRQRGGHQAGRGARLQQRGQAEAGGESGEAIAAAPCRGSAAGRDRTRAARR